MKLALKAVTLSILYVIGATLAFYTLIALGIFIGEHQEGTAQSLSPQCLFALLSPCL